jgi:3-oxoacyl-[acyl-carrier-protein] synthase-3|tara:strand:- start:42 stop:947 length:906 start_codon:yes stop_codon:yes gene_type:complete
MSIIFIDIQTSLGKKIENNLKLEKLFKWPNGKILEKIGIKKRYLSKKNQTTSSLAKEAVKKITKKNKMSNVRYIVSVTNTPSKGFPSLAHELAYFLNDNKKFMCIGINAGCTGYVDALFIAYKLLKPNEEALIVTSDTYSKYIDPKNKSIRPIFSDGASCTLLRCATKNGWVLKDKFFFTEKNTLDYLDFDHKKIRMDGPEVLSFAIRNVVKSILKMIKKEKTLIFAHQAGKVILNVIKSKISSKNFFPENYQELGNLVSTSIPMLIKENFHLFKKNKRILISGFGVGLSHSHILIKKNKL